MRARDLSRPFRLDIEPGSAGTAPLLGGEHVADMDVDSCEDFSDEADSNVLLLFGCQELSNLGDGALTKVGTVRVEFGAGGTYTGDLWVVPSRGAVSGVTTRGSLSV